MSLIARERVNVSMRVFTPLLSLTEADMAYCKVIAGIRRMANRQRGTGNYFNLGADQNNDNEELGVIAEYAFCKAHNIFFDGTFAGKDCGYDCVLKQHHIDVKAVDCKSHNLVAYIKEENRLIDVYVLVYVDGAETSIVGWARRDELINDNNIRDLGYGNRYFLHQSKLHEWRNERKPNPETNPADLL